MPQSRIEWREGKFCVCFCLIVNQIVILLSLLSGEAGSQSAVWISLVLLWHSILLSSCILFVLFYGEWWDKFNLFPLHPKIDMEEKVANFDLPTIGCGSQIQFGAMKTIGSHNYHNAAVAALCIIGLNIGINAAAISSIIGKLRTPPHRMQIGKLKLVLSPCNNFICTLLSLSLSPLHV